MRAPTICTSENAPQFTCWTCSPTSHLGERDALFGYARRAPHHLLGRKMFQSWWTKWTSKRLGGQASAQGDVFEPCEWRDMLIVCWRGKTYLVFLDNKLNAALCIKMLQAHLELFMKDHYTNCCVFQQDGAPAHWAKFTRDYFAEADITDTSWAPSSRHEVYRKLLLELAMSVYESGRQFGDIEELKEAVFYAWGSIDLATVRHLISSIPRRVITLYSKSENSTKY